ncbi:MAG: LCP family protein [Oscillospiraceae bacterium]|nr:LCP family protein [Oscillospiraceae bacterium]
MSKKEFRPNNGTRNKKKTIVIVCSVFLGVVLCVFGTAALYINHMLDKIDYENVPGEEGGQSVVEVSDDNSLWNNNILNILLLGTDERSDEYSDNARSDCMMILSLNRKTHKMRLISLERGIGVPIEGQEDDWLTHTFAYGGAALTLKTVQECFELDVDRYVRVNFNSFEQIIDAIGGVDIELTELEAQGLNGEIYTNAITKHTVYEGMNHLDGYDALQYARQRFIDSDWHRIERQRNVVSAAFDRVKTMSVFEWNSLLETALPLVKTNFTKAEITSLLLDAPGFTSSEIEQMTIPAADTYGSKETSDGRSLLDLDWDTNIQILKNFINS